MSRVSIGSWSFGSKKAYRPPAYHCTWWSALRNLPRRIVTPPAAEGKHQHRSCNIVPIFRVALEDILDGKHLPPLSLKDFEEYLLFDERSAENLYFILWLREYTKRHRAWFATATTTSRSLALSFTRAKSTFFSHSSPHELNLASVLISDFLISAEGQPHPHPAVFNQIMHDVEYMLRESLLRFVAARTKNAGKQRVWCALIGGVGTSLLALAPLLISILQNKPRSLRLAALPLLWLGATIFLSSMHGICFIIYILGDARQLYPFELARPPISSPQPMSAHSPTHLPPAISGFTLGHAYTGSTASALNEKLLPIRGPSMTQIVSPPLTPAGILVSSPFPESPTTLPPTVTRPARVHHSHTASNLSSMSVPVIPPYSPALSSPFDTAQFIAPFDPRFFQEDAAAGPNQTSLSDKTKAMRPLQSGFNFDELPGQRRIIPHQRSTSLDVPPESLGSRLCRMARQITPRPPAQSTTSTPLIAPLTRVWSPVITRAQWEIVIRSSMVGLAFAAVVVGALLAVPVHTNPGQPWYDGYANLGL